MAIPADGPTVVVDTPVAVSEAAETNWINRLSWRAILAGVVISLGVAFLLNLLGLGIGVWMLDPLGGDTPRSGTLIVIGMIWWTLSLIIAAYAGGITAGRLSGRPSTTTAGWHGLIAFAATMLISLYILTTSVGAIIGGAFSVVGNALGGAGQAVAAAAPAVVDAVDPFAGVETGIRDAASADNPSAAADAAIAYARAALTGDQADAEAARQRAVDALARAANIPPDQAQARIQELETQYRAAADRAAQTAAEAADTARKAVASGALLGFIALVFGALAGWFGGATAAPQLERATAWLTRGTRRE